MSEKKKFDDVLKEIRGDLDYILELYGFLLTVSKGQGAIDEDMESWMYDTFLDKIYEINAKVKRFMENVEAERMHVNDARLDRSLNDIVESVRLIVHHLGRPNPLSFSGERWDFDLWREFGVLRRLIENYRMEIEAVMSSIRKNMHELDWQSMKRIKTEDYVAIQQRKRFVKARDELEHARKAINNSEWDDVLNHLRQAIDLAIKERFGFQKIHPMKQFLDDADKLSFPLPSYTMLYDYFDEGSGRIHGGKINTPWECKQALSFVADFIDQLDLLNISQKEIDAFKSKCKAIS